MSSVYALQTPSAIYREEQRFGWWVYALVALLFVLGWLLLATRKAPMPGELGEGRIEFSLGVTLGLAIPAVLVVGVLKMTTEVVPGQIRVWFGWIPTYRRIIAMTEVTSVEVVRYRPIQECRGWGIRTGPQGERVLTARGDRGVRLNLSDGSRILIGSQTPDLLAMAIQASIPPC